MAQVQAPVNQLGQAKAQGEGGRKNQPGIGHQAVIVEAMRMRSGWWRGSIYWVLLFRDRFAVTKPYPRFRGAPFGHFRTLTRRPPSVDSGLSLACLLKALAVSGSLPSVLGILSPVVRFRSQSLSWWAHMFAYSREVSEAAGRMDSSIP